MKNNLIKFVAIALTGAMALATSCKKDDDATLSVAPEATNLVFSADGAKLTSGGTEIPNKSFTVTTNQSDWSVAVTPAGSWVTAQKSGNSFTLSAAANNSATTPAAATVTVTAGNAKPVTMNVQQSGSVQVTGIAVNPTTLELSVGDSELVMATLLPLDHTEQGLNNTLLWESDDEDVVTVEGGMVTVVGAGKAVVKVWLERKPTIYAEIPVSVGVSMYMSQFQARTVDGADYLFSEIAFGKNAQVFILGFDESKIENAYNRDFFTYDSETGELTFIGESGSYEVYYSERLNHFFVYKEFKTDQPHNAWWITGQGVCSALEWNGIGGGWRLVPEDFAYLVPKEDGTYQGHAWLRTEFSLALRRFTDHYSFNFISEITGDTQGMNLLDALGEGFNTHFQGMGGGFENGYFLITLTPEEGAPSPTTPPTGHAGFFALHFERLLTIY